MFTSGAAVATGRKFGTVCTTGASGSTSFTVSGCVQIPSMILFGGLHTSASGSKKERKYLRISVEKKIHTFYHQKALCFTILQAHFEFSAVLGPSDPLCF